MLFLSEGWQFLIRFRSVLFLQLCFLGPVIFQTYIFWRGGRVRAAIQLGAADRLRIESRCHPSTEFGFAIRHLCLLFSSNRCACRVATCPGYW